MKSALDTAKELEAHFLRQIFAEVRSSLSSIAGGGFAGETFHEMLDEALADSMAKAGGVGIAKMVEAQLEASGQNVDASDDKPQPPTAPLKVSTGRSIQKYGGGHAD